VNQAGPGDLDEHGPLPERLVSINQLVAYNMTYFRKAARLTQEELGERLGGWSGASVSAAERSWDGKRVRKFDADEVVRIALALGIPVIALLLPPGDAGTAVQYLLDTEPGQPAMTSLLPRLAPAPGEDAPQQTAFRQRLLELGVSSYMDPAAVDATELLDRASAEAKAILGKSRAYSEQLTGEARVRAESLEIEVQERYHEALDSLLKSREELEQRVADLRAFERDYRGRLLAYLETQVRELRAGAISSETGQP
jgi:transcriptional regulator with XRE-family HTH domain